MVNNLFDKVPLSTLLNGSLDVRFVQITNRNGNGSKPPVQTPALG
jgi:hypothetical protein